MIALDLFAGTGWGVACQALGIEEYGVEIMPEAVATREANGMTTLYRDVWTGLDSIMPEAEDFFSTYDTLIASPPCQTFSMAGGGAGRKALDDVLGLIDAKAYRSVEDLRAFGETHDPRTALVLTPLAHVYRDVPTFVVFEQVPPVLPVWERCAEEMRAWGYSVWVGILSAEQYGVPQTRKRAILIARADGIEAAPPTPTHSRYYPTDPTRLDDGVEPWVSMAEALGWGMTERPFITVGNAVGRAEGVGGSGGKRAVEREKAKGARQSNNNTSTTGERYERDVEHPAPTITAGQRSARWLIGNQKPGGRETYQERPASEPAPTVTAMASRNRWESEQGHVSMRSNYGTGGDPAKRGERDLDEPSATITSKADRNMWMKDRPATTVTGDPRIMPPGHRVNADDIARLGHDEARERYAARSGGDPLNVGAPTAERVTVAEAAALQSYPDGFVWDVEVPDPKTGKLKPITKTKTFLQIGNAVPPLLAYRILEGFLS